MSPAVYFRSALSQRKREPEVPAHVSLATDKAIPTSAREGGSLSSGVLLWLDGCLPEAWTTDMWAQQEFAQWLHARADEQSADAAPS